MPTISKTENQGLHPFEQEQRRLDKEVADRRRRRFIGRLILYPLAFLLCGGSLFFFVWLVEKENAEGIHFCIRIAVIGCISIGYIVGFCFVSLRILRWLGLEWILDDDNLFKNE